jgi:hypothetical protein
MGWFGRLSQAKAYRRFVRTLHAAATLGVMQGSIQALAGLALIWPLAQWAGRWQQGRRAAALPRGALPRHLLP